MTLGNGFRIQCTFSNIGSVAMLMKKSNKITKRRGDGVHCHDDVSGTLFRSQCTFLYMEGMAMVNKKNRNKIKIIE
jgi:hypothetical protein